MKSVVLRNQEVTIQDVAKPIPKPGEVLIRVSIAGICNTDIEISRGYMNYQGILGHEFVGLIEEAEERDLIGRRVVGEINLACRNCEWCNKVLERQCPNRSVLGILNKDGVMAEYVTLPVENIHLVEDSISDLQAVFTEPLAAAFEILEQIQVGSDSSVLLDMRT